MRVPFIEELRVRIVGQAMAPIPVSPIWVQVVEETENLQRWLATATVKYEQRASPGIPEGVVRERAVEAFCHHIYGPVLQELHELQHELWQEGLPGSSNAQKRLTGLRKALEGRTRLDRE